MPEFYLKQQVAYIPLHACGDVTHPDVQFGFVGTMKGNNIFVHYWRKGEHVLRTLSGAENTDKDLLIAYDSVSQQDIDKAWKSLYGIIKK